MIKISHPSFVLGTTNSQWFQPKLAKFIRYFSVWMLTNFYVGLSKANALMPDVMPSQLHYHSLDVQLAYNDYNKLRWFFGKPVREGKDLLWFEPNIQLFPGFFKASDPFFVLGKGSTGIGYRRSLSSSQIIGAYLFYDFTFPFAWFEASPLYKPMHTVNLGLEYILSDIGRIEFNSYASYYHPADAYYFPRWSRFPKELNGANIKFSYDWNSYLKTAIGGYYQSVEVINRYPEGFLENKENNFGIIAELKCVEGIFKGWSISGLWDQHSPIQTATRFHIAIRYHVRFVKEHASSLYGVSRYWQQNADLWEPVERFSSPAIISPFYNSVILENRIEKLRNAREEIGSLSNLMIDITENLKPFNTSLEQRKETAKLGLHLSEVQRLFLIECNQLTKEHQVKPLPLEIRSKVASYILLDAINQPDFLALEQPVNFGYNWKHYLAPYQSLDTLYNHSLTLLSYLSAKEAEGNKVAIEEFLKLPTAEVLLNNLPHGEDNLSISE